MYQRKAFTIKPTDVIFFLDDDNARIWEFIQMLHGVGHDRKHLTIAENVKSAGWVLNDQKVPFDWVFLDHDLDPMHYDNLRQSAVKKIGTGQEVIPMLSPYCNDSTKYVLHTMNPHGSEAMHTELYYRRQVDAHKITRVIFGSFDLIKETA